MKILHLLEAQNALFKYIKDYVPKWPDAVIDELFYSTCKKYVNEMRELKKHMSDYMENLGITPDTVWQLKKVHFTLDMFDDHTKQTIISKINKTDDPHLRPENDDARHVTQQALAMKEGGIRSQPVILLVHPNKSIELVEGYHRTVQHFKLHPDGYIGPAWMAATKK